jgi:hypothetical protein
MSTNPYYKFNSQWFWAPENSYGKLLSGRSQWAANQAGDTFYTMPIETQEGFAVIRNENKYERIWGGNSSEPILIKKGGKKPITATMGGPVYDHSQCVYFLTDTVTNAGAGDPYTHTVASTDSLPAKPPTIALLRKMVNGTGGETKWFLYPGTVVKMWEERGDVEIDDGNVYATITYDISRVVDGVALSSEPTRTITEPLQMTADASSISWHDHNYSWQGYEWKYNTDKTVKKEGGTVYPTWLKMANKRDHGFKLRMVPYETDTYDDSQDDPHSGGNKDLVCTIARDASNDFWKMTYNDVFQNLEESEMDEYLVEGHWLYVNPHDTGSTYEFVDKNSYDATRYGDAA